VSNDMVHFRLDVECMKHSIQSALVDYQGEVRAEIDRCMKAYIEGDGFRRDIADAVRQHASAAVRQRVKWAIDDALRTESRPLTDLVQKAVAEALSPERLE